MNMTEEERDVRVLHMALPKGRMQDGVFSLLRDAGIEIRASSRGYRPELSVPDFEVKILKPQNIVEMLHVGSRDVGFAGADWVAELNADLVELLNTGMDPVRIVAAAPGALLETGKLPKRRLIVASEFTRLTNEWIARRGLDATFVRSYGATEVFPPEDADCIVDVAASGATLRANGLVVLDELMSSSTRFYANPRVMENPRTRETVEGLVLLLRSVLEARNRVMLEVNVSAANLESLISVLPCMREPTISTLHGNAGYAVKVAAPKNLLPMLIPEIKKRGGTDVVVSSLSQIVP
jgi:ATP phosphoribosyltransferase